METNGTWLPVCCTSQCCTEFSSARINPKVFGPLRVVTEWCISLLQLPVTCSGSGLLNISLKICPWLLHLFTHRVWVPVCNPTLPLPDSPRDRDVLLCLGTWFFCAALRGKPWGELLEQVVILTAHCFCGGYFSHALNSKIPVGSGIWM